MRQFELVQKIIIAMQAASLYSSNQLKYYHVMRENSALVQSVEQLEGQLLALRKINQLLVEKNESYVLGELKEVNQHNRRLQAELQRLTVSNSQHLCEILMKSQLICEANKQRDEIVKEYQEKIADLRELVLRKEEHMDNLEKKYAAQKQRPVEKPNHCNLYYLSEVGDLKMYLDRLNIECSQLKYVNLLKEQQIANLRKRLHGYQITFRKMGLPQLQQSRNSTAETSALSQQSRHNARSKISSEISKFDSGYHDMFVYKRAATFNLGSMKLMLTHLLNQNSNLLKQKMKLEATHKRMAHDHRILQDAYKKMQKINQNANNSIELLKINIKTIEQNANKQYRRCQQASSIIQSFERQKQLLRSYWKQFSQNQNWKNLSNKCIFSTKRIISSQMKYRSKSCLPFFKYTKSPFDRQQKNIGQTQCFSDISNICDEFVLVDRHNRKRQNSSFMFVDKHNRKRQNSSFMFDDDISMISKKKPIRFRSDYEGDLKEIDLD